MRVSGLGMSPRTNSIVAAICATVFTALGLAGCVREPSVQIVQCTDTSTTSACRGPVGATGATGPTGMIGPARACTSHEECAPGTCNMVSGLCVGETGPTARCTDSSECAPGICVDSGQCVGSPATCTNDDQCAPGTCNEVSGLCVGPNGEPGEAPRCTNHAQCAPGTCNMVSGLCVGPPPQCSGTVRTSTSGQCYEFSCGGVSLGAPLCVENGVSGAAGSSCGPEPVNPRCYRIRCDDGRVSAPICAPVPVIAQCDPTLRREETGNAVRLCFGYVCQVGDEEVTDEVCLDFPNPMTQPDAGAPDATTMPADTGIPPDAGLADTGLIDAGFIDAGPMSCVWSSTTRFVGSDLVIEVSCGGVIFITARTPNGCFPTDISPNGCFDVRCPGRADQRICLPRPETGATCAAEVVITTASGRTNTCLEVACTVMSSTQRQSACIDQATPTPLDGGTMDAGTPDTGPVDSGVFPDAAAPDATAPDAAPDSGPIDSGVHPDAAAPDATSPDATAPDATMDAGTPDTGPVDSGVFPDAALPDAMSPDANPDASTPDTGGPSDSGNLSGDSGATGNDASAGDTGSGDASSTDGSINLPNQSNVDNDGDGYCEIAPCASSSNSFAPLANLQGGDCDDDPTGGTWDPNFPQWPICSHPTQGVWVFTGGGTCPAGWSTVMVTDGSIFNHPGMHDTVDRYDNNCNGALDEGGADRCTYRPDFMIRCASMLF